MRVIYFLQLTDALEEHDGKVSKDARNITYLRFADGIDALAEKEQELEALVESLDKTCTRSVLRRPLKLATLAYV